MHYKLVKEYHPFCHEQLILPHFRLGNLIQATLEGHSIFYSRGFQPYLVDVPPVASQEIGSPPAGLGGGVPQQLIDK